MAASPQVENGYIKIANEFWDALCTLRVPGEARQALDVIIRKTWGYNKKADYISISQFVILTGIKSPNIVRCLRKLVQMRLIITSDNKRTTWYQIQKDYHKWCPLSKKIINKQNEPIINNKEMRSLSEAITPVIQKDNNSLSKAIDTKDNDKDNVTKDIAKATAETADSQGECGSGKDEWNDEEIEAFHKRIENIGNKPSNVAL